MTKGVCDWRWKQNNSKKTNHDNWRKMVECVEKKTKGNNSKLIKLKGVVHPQRCGHELVNTISMQSESMFENFGSEQAL